MMRIQPSVRTPWHLWAVGILSLLWNAIGALDYTMTKLHNQAYLAAMTPEQMAWIDAFPVWANAGWAVGVWSAIAGSLLLLARSRWAITAFGLSLVGLAVTTFYQYALSDMPASLRTTAGTLFCALLWAIAITLYLYARRMRARGVLR